MASENRKPIRVLVVDDSYFMRKLLGEVLGAAEGLIQVVDTARNGQEAIEKNRRLKPDVLTLDVEMPEMDGLAALERIMREDPVPVVMLSSHTGAGTETTIRALELGAVECVLKPAGKPVGNLAGVRDELIEKIQWASRCRPRSPLPSLKAPPVRRAPAPTARNARSVIAVASSTGGPRALQEFVGALPDGLPAAVVVVQHIAAGFTQALARRLDEAGPLEAEEASDGSEILEGRIYVAPAGRHLEITGSPGFLRVRLQDDPPRLGVRPSADVMMASAARTLGAQCLGVVLTGMGKDGSEGLRRIKEAGGGTFAQDEGTCVVYGMPKAAVEAGIVGEQGPPSLLAQRAAQRLA